MYQLLGGYDGTGSEGYRSVFEYNINTTQWKQVGDMKISTNRHGISTVPVHQILDYCF